MFCHACGSSLAQQMKFCNRCGAQLIAQDQTAEVKRTEKRLDEYLDGLFWITFFGVGFIFGGMVVMKKVGLSDLFILAYLLISSTAFLVNFVINLLAALRIGKKSRDLPARAERDTAHLPVIQSQLFDSIPSITEHTTRSFEPVPIRTKPEER